MTNAEKLTLKKHACHIRMGRVSVPMRPINLSVRLQIVDLVSRYLTNYLI